MSGLVHLAQICYWKCSLMEEYELIYSPKKVGMIVQL